MLFINYRIATSPIDTGKYIVKCPSCESDQWADVMILSNYACVFIVPIFPVGKEANIVCKKCGLKRYGSSFDSKLISDYEAVKKQYLHPWVTYADAAIIAFPFVIWIVFSIFS